MPDRILLENEDGISADGRLRGTAGAAHTLEQGNTGVRNPDSDGSDYTPVRQECNITICDGTSAVTIGGGAANDTHLMGILILKDATPATATITGFKKKDNAAAEAAQSFIVSGSTADDRYIDFKGAKNDGGALTVQGNVDEKVVVFWRAV